MKIKLILTVISLLLSAISIAGRYHTQTLTSWTFELNNGVAYVGSTLMPSHCSYSRAQIKMSGTEFDKALFAMVLAAYKSKTDIKVVIDRDDTVCVISGVIDHN